MMSPMKTAWKVTVSVLAALLVLLLVAEFGLRAFMAGQIRSDMAAQNPETISAEQADEAKVSFGPSPLTLGLLRGVVPHVAMTTPSTLVAQGETYTGQPGADISVDNLSVADGRQVAGRLRMTTDLPDDYVRAILQEQLSSSIQGGGASFLDGLLTVSGVASHPETGTFTVEVSDGAAAIDLRPAMVNDSLTFEAASTELFGFQLPDTVTRGITSALQQGVEDAVNSEMRVTEFTVVDGALRVTVEGENVDMEKLSATGAQPDAARVG